MYHVYILVIIFDGWWYRHIFHNPAACIIPYAAFHSLLSVGHVHGRAHKHVPGISPLNKKKRAVPNPPYCATGCFGVQRVLCCPRISLPVGPDGATG